jgi:hypothetical protein
VRIAEHGLTPQRGDKLLGKGVTGEVDHFSLKYLDLNNLSEIEYKSITWHFTVGRLCASGGHVAEAIYTVADVYVRIKGYTALLNPCWTKGLWQYTGRTATVAVTQPGNRQKCNAAQIDGNLVRSLVRLR